MKTLALNEELYAYMLRHSSREPEVLHRLRLETANHPRYEMQITAQQGAFMGLLVKMMGAKNVLELGVFTGYSSLAVALALPEDGKITACDVSEEYTAVGRRYWQEAGVDKKISLILQPALKTLDGLRKEGHAGAFDLAFIDADKQNYLAYYESCVELLRPGGILLIDNVLWGGAVTVMQQQDPETVAVREVNARVANDQRVEACMLPIADGLTLVRKN